MDQLPDINLTDEELVQKALNNADDFYLLMRRYEQKLLHYILRITSISRECAEDILQEVFIKIYRNLRGFDPKLKFSAWIYRITHNETISYIRKTQSRPVIINIEDEELVNFLRSSFDVKQEYVTHELNTKVQQILAMLPEHYREILVLRYFEDLDYQAISDVLTMPMGTVATQLNRAKAQFKALALKYRLDNFTSAK